MSFYEQYSMSIPLFAPSLEFLTQLHLRHRFIDGRRFIRREPRRRAPLPPHPKYNGSAKVPAFNMSSQAIILDPDDDFDALSLRHWLALCDYYTFPHVVLFESIEHLIDILQTLWTERYRLEEVSNSIREANRNRLKSLLRYWRMRLKDIAENSPNRPE